MNIFDEKVLQTVEILKGETLKKLDESECWEVNTKNTFLMDKDTQIELGGYPKESVNLIIPTSNLYGLTDIPGGTYIIGDEASFQEEKHASFGKIVLLETEDIDEEKLYDFTQKILLSDSRIFLNDVMLRQSSTHYNLNLRIGKKAMENRFSLGRMANTVFDAFVKLEEVKSAIVILLYGDSELYKGLLDVAEKVKGVTLTLNHIFDGIDMDCGSCVMSPVCDEVEGLREMHKRKARG